MPERTIDIGGKAYEIQVYCLAEPLWLGAKRRKTPDKRERRKGTAAWLGQRSLYGSAEGTNRRQLVTVRVARPARAVCAADHNRDDLWITPLPKGKPL